MILRYPLPPRIPACFFSGSIHLPPGYFVLIDEFGIHYLIFGAEDLLGVWPLAAFEEDGVRAVRRDIADFIATHEEKAKNWKPQKPDDNKGEPENGNETDP